MIEIKPAIAPEHWPERLSARQRFGFAETWEDMHDAAALALHGRPFGFTWEDVDLLRDATTTPPDDEACRHLIDSLLPRIAALLPPRDG